MPDAGGMGGSPPSAAGAAGGGWGGGMAEMLQNPWIMALLSGGMGMMRAGQQGSSTGQSLGAGLGGAITGMMGAQQEQKQQIYDALLKQIMLRQAGMGGISGVGGVGGMQTPGIAPQNPTPLIPQTAAPYGY